MVCAPKIGLSILSLFVYIALLVSCPGVNDADVLRLNDTIGPVIVINSPADGDQYEPLFSISGTVTDAATTGAENGEVTGLSYSISPADSIGDITFGDDGSFLVEINGSGFLGPQTITLTGTDWNGETVNLGG